MIPRIATYRLQFRNGMTFDRAAGIVPYLADLGVSHLYASPIFAATEGSTHGYDITDYNRIDPALGGQAGFLRLSAALKQAGLGLMLDIVPNHMSASMQNPWWREVVEWGAAAPHARHFDIDWSERLTLPMLDSDFATVQETGTLALAIDTEHRGLVLCCGDVPIPLAPPSYDMLDDPAFAALRAAAADADPARPDRFHKDIAPLLTDEITPALTRLSQDRDHVARLHDAQPWVLTDWRTAKHHLSYRRFFEVTGLVGTRVEDPQVFDDIHRLTLDLVRQGHVDALRVDHVDGLADPTAYLHRLRGAVGADVWIIVEKITEGAETLPSGWPVEGTTGYEFIAAMTDLFTDNAGAARLQTAYANRTGSDPADRQRARIKRVIVTRNFEGELNRLTDLLCRHSDGHPGTLRDALTALIVGLPVYRTYGDAAGFCASDAALLRQTAETVSADPRAMAEVLRVLSDPEAAELRSRFQQLTGPAMAKAVEDTLFYRHNAMMARNEVGADPASPPAHTDQVHAALARRGRQEPFGLLASATHDTKRGEDARARLCALSHLPENWLGGIDALAAMAASPAPDADVEWLILQSLCAIWPLDDALDDGALGALKQRFSAYLTKALREANRQTDWAEQDELYEQAAMNHAMSLLDNPAFRSGFSVLLSPIAALGNHISLAQTLIKLTAPGIPDIYQGSEFADFSLVDPDNRRPVDFENLARQSRIAHPDRRAMPERKIELIQKVLADRRSNPALYALGNYTAVPISGGDSNLFAFLRSYHDIYLLVVLRLAPTPTYGAQNAILHPPAHLPLLVEMMTGKPLTGTAVPVDRLLGADEMAIFHSPRH